MQIIRVCIMCELFPFLDFGLSTPTHVLLHDRHHKDFFLFKIKTFFCITWQYKISRVCMCCIAAYTKAFEMAQTEGDKSDVLSAIAMVWYKFGDRDKTKTTLFQR